jgi:hypothetical protein
MASPRRKRDHSLPYPANSALRLDVGGRQETTRARAALQNAEDWPEAGACSARPDRDAWIAEQESGAVVDLFADEVEHWRRVLKAPTVIIAFEPDVVLLEALDAEIFYAHIGGGRVGALTGSQP